MYVCMHVCMYVLCRYIHTYACIKQLPDQIHNQFTITVEEHEQECRMGFSTIHMYVYAHTCSMYIVYVCRYVSCMYAYDVI